MEAANSTEGNKVVVQYNFGVDGKVAKAITTAYSKKIKDKAIMLVSANGSANRFMIVAFAPKGMKGVDSKA